MRKILPLFLILILASLFLILTDHYNLISPIQGFFQRPIIRMEEGIMSGYQGILGIIRGLNGQVREAETLRLEGSLRQLAVDQNQLNVCREENEKLKKLLGTPLPSTWKFLMAKVVGLSGEMRVDKGKQDGVKEGMMVISENILVGRVTAVDEFISRVQKLDDVRTKIPVVVKRPASAGASAGKPGGNIQARGLLVGQGGSLILDRVLQSEDIQKGDLVVTSGEEGWLGDLVIGQVEEVLPKSAEVYKKAKVTPLVDYQKLRIVFLVIR